MILLDHVLKNGLHIGHWLEIEDEHGVYAKIDGDAIQDVLMEVEE